MASSSKGKTFSAETKLVEGLTAILDASNLTELEFETEEISIRLSRGSTAVAPAMMAAPAAMPAAPAAAGAPPAPAAASDADTDIASHPLSLIHI